MTEDPHGRRKAWTAYRGRINLTDRKLLASMVSYSPLQPLILRQWNLVAIFIGAVYMGKVWGGGGEEAVLGAEKSRRGKVFGGWARLTVNF